MPESLTPPFTVANSSRPSTRSIEMPPFVVFS
jgi:hypothetical protein